MDGKFAPKRGTRCWLFEALERLKTGKDAVASKALKLATKCLSRLSRPEKLAPAPRMSELMIPASNSDRPALLENRIFLLRVAVEVLATLESRDACDTEISRLVSAHLINCETSTQSSHKH